MAIFLALYLAVEFAVYVFLAVVLAKLFDWPPGSVPLLVVLAAVSTRALAVFTTHTVAIFFAAARPPELRRRSQDTVRMMLGEIWATLVMFTGLQTIEPWLGLRGLASAAGNRTLPVLFVHGYICNGSYWLVMIRDLRRRGMENLFTINLVPPFASMQAYDQAIAERVEGILQSTGAKRLIIVAHSMGGLVARRYLNSEHGASRVAKIITLASPHRGTLIGRLSPTPNAREMRPESEFLFALNSNESVEPCVPITSIFSYDDNIIMPQDSSKLDHARNIGVVAVGHLAMSFSETIRRLVYQELTSDDALTGHSRS